MDIPFFQYMNLEFNIPKYEPKTFIERVAYHVSMVRFEDRNTGGGLKYSKYRPYQKVLRDLIYSHIHDKSTFAKELQQRGE